MAYIVCAWLCFVHIKTIFILIFLVLQWWRCDFVLPALAKHCTKMCSHEDNKSAWSRRQVCVHFYSATRLVEKIYVCMRLIAFGIHTRSSLHTDCHWRNGEAAVTDVGATVTENTSILAWRTWSVCWTGTPAACVQAVWFLFGLLLPFVWQWQFQRSKASLLSRL